MRRFLFVLSLLTVAGCADERRGPNVLFVTVDALRADHLGAYGYHRATSPNIDAYFAVGTLYERAYATEANTSPSVVSFLTGQLPQENGLRLMLQKVPRDLMTLPDYLSEHGYQTAAVVSNPVLAAEAMDLDAHFDYYDDYMDERESRRDLWERTAGPTTDAALLWYATAYDADRPYFLWIHYQDPHGPYDAPPDKPVDFDHERAVEIDSMRVPAYERKPGVTDGLEYVDAYDEEIAYMDEHVGRLLESFAAEGLLDDTIVIFSADHGEAMMEHERWFTHAYHVMVRFPADSNGRRVQTRVSLVDVAPTILDAAGIDVPEAMSGQVLRGNVEPGPVYAQGGAWRSMTLDDTKWLVQVSKKQRGGSRPNLIIERRWVYELDTDPRELNRKRWVTTDASEAFFEFIRNDPDPGGIPAEYADGMLPEAPKIRPGVDEETLRKLRALGYVD